MITIVEANTKQLLTTFVKFPFSLYKNHPYWVPPLITDELETFDKTKNPVFTSAEANFFLAYQDSKVVGRIAAIINWDEVNNQQKRKVRFGWWDVIDDIEVTKALLEKEVLNAADTIIVTSKTTKTEFQALTSKPIEVITNGYDVEKIEKQPLDDKFTLAHIGSFLSERNPMILWQALQELISENADFKKDFRLKLIGATSQEVIDTISEFKLTNYIQNLGYVSHQEAVEQQRKSQVLLLIEINSEDTKSIIPGKLFEYMVSERPIIGIGPKDSDFAEIIASTNTGVFFTYDEKEKLKALLLKYYQEYQNQNLKVHAVGLQRYSRKSLTEQLVKLINS